MVQDCIVQFGPPAPIGTTSASTLAGAHSCALRWTSSSHMTQHNLQISFLIEPIEVLVERWRSAWALALQSIQFYQSCVTAGAKAFWSQRFTSSHFLLFARCEGVHGHTVALNINELAGGLKLDSSSFSVAFFYFNLFNLGLLLWFIKKKIFPHLFLQGSGLITWQHIPVINPWSCTAALWQEALLVWLQDFLLQRQRAAK